MSRGRALVAWLVALLGVALGGESLAYAEDVSLTSSVDADTARAAPVAGTGTSMKRI